MTDERVCLWCGRELQRRDDETLWNWEKRAYCDKRHSALHTNERKKPKKRNISMFLSPLHV
ncbi:MAG: hypothetical protein ACOYL3_07125 [Desulfuromonadaceae bacterium]